MEGNKPKLNPIFLALVTEMAVIPVKHFVVQEEELLREGRE